jgi:hypothetical protein
MDKITGKFVPKSARLKDQVREVLRFHHYAYNTEKSYISWILKYIRFHNKKHPKTWESRILRHSSVTLLSTALRNMGQRAILSNILMQHIGSSPLTDHWSTRYAQPRLSVCYFFDKMSAR